MNTKKLIAFLLVLCTVLTLMVGCEKSEVKTEKSSKTESSQNADKQDQTEEEAKDESIAVDHITDENTFKAKMETLIDVSNYSYQNNKTNFYYSLSYNNRADYNIDGKWQFEDGSAIQLPITFSELEKIGWTLTEESDGDTRELESGHASIGWITNKDGDILNVMAYNHTNSTTFYKNCTVYNIELQAARVSMDYTVCGSITKDFNIEDIISILGAPTTVSCHPQSNSDGTYKGTNIYVRYDNTDGSYIEFLLSGDDDCIISITNEIKPT